MNITLVTIFGDNYGNKLQNFALQYLLESMGHSVETIIVEDGVKFHEFSDTRDFISKFTPSHVTNVISSRFKNKYPYKNQRDGIRKSIAFSKSDIPATLNSKRVSAFQNFSEKHIHVAKQKLLQGDVSYSIAYDAYVCGSDQIWNPTYSSTSAPYFLQFAPENKRIAFAPSFGLSTIPEYLQPLYKKWLCEIPYLSVREEAGAWIIKNITGREVPVLPDPTLCLSKEDWEKVESKPNFVKSYYVLTYFLGNETNKYRRFIEGYAKEKDYQIINLFDMRDPDYYDVDPAEFVWLIHHAKAMFTDSFHGTVFSIIFHTPFVVFDRVESGGTGMSSRIDTLLNMVDLSNRRFGNVKKQDVDVVDFSSADTAIKKQVDSAKDFLHISLLHISESKVVDSNKSYVQRYKKDCSGCTACMNACPVKCISMQTDDEGFYYPTIDSNKCIHCNKCIRTCDAASSRIATNLEKAYIAFSDDKSIRLSSSSGGIFSEIARVIIHKGGCVYGVAYSDTFSVVHKSVNNNEDIPSLRGSKYVQSDLSSTFTEIKQKLQKGNYVLFSGTPCQVDGLLSYLGKDYENLILQDIICHGVPSPKVWEEYLKYRANGRLVKRVSFRDKGYGWHYFSMMIQTDKKTYRKRLDQDLYLRLFLENVILRPSCYDCKHKHLHRKSDFTIGDCWSLGTFGVDVKDDDKGLSLVFVNTEKGNNLLKDIYDNLQLCEVPFDVATGSQGALTQSVQYNKNRDVFFEQVKEKGWKKTIVGWYNSGIPENIKITYGYMRYRVAKILKRK